MNSDSGVTRSGPSSSSDSILLYSPPRREDYPSRPSSNWRDGLFDVLSHLEESSSSLSSPTKGGDHQVDISSDPIVLFGDDKYVCIYDKFPKAKFHLLLMRRRCNEHVGDMVRVRTLDDLEPSHVGELRKFHALGRGIASRLVRGPRDDADATSSSRGGPPPALVMKLGYHALPSFEPLHLNIISDDMDSPCVTKRKHITSFDSTLFFVSPEAVEGHLDGAFANDVSIRVRRERARDVLDWTPLTCSQCGKVAGSVHDWKRHRRLCDERAPANDGKDTTGDKTLNSLLGWRRRVVSTVVSTGMQPSDRETTMGRRSSKEESGYIMPMTPARFTIGESRTRYLIYMAIREGKESKFARGLARCNDAINDELRHCLQLEKTRHVTMYDGYLSADQVRGLDFRGRLDYPIEIKLDGWKNWDTGAYLGVSGKSECDLRRLLNEVDGLPHQREKENEKCDHLSLYRRRRDTRMPYDDMKREFWNMRTTTKSHDWGIVEGMSIRIKAYGGPYFDCRVLADAMTTCRGPSP